MKQRLGWAALVAGMSIGGCGLADPITESAGDAAPVVAQVVQNGRPAGNEAPRRPAGGSSGPAAFVPGTESGFATWQTQCAVCHGNPTVPDARSPEAIRRMSPEEIFASLVSGDMTEQAGGLSDIQKQRVAEFMAGRSLGSADAGDARRMANRCSANPPFAGIAQAASWNGWGADLFNTRFQPGAEAALAVADVPRLKLKWAFGYPAGLSSNAQPTVAAGRVFVGSDNGYVYSLDARTGCVYWSFETGSMIRGAAVVGLVTGQGRARYAVYVGDSHANVYAVDAENGKLLWKTRVDPHFVARITAGAKLYDGKLFVPVSSSEEFSSGNPGYPCCTSRGSVVALDASTGEQIWKAWVVPGEPKPYATQPNGVSVYKPAGGAVWNSPTVDPVRHAVYFGTGDATTAPPPTTTDGVMAVDIETGAFLWAYQATPNDVFMGGCGGEAPSPACPAPMGPDMDIGNSPILATLPDGRRVLMGGTKAGDVFAMDPDDNGKLLYRVNLAGGEPGGTRRFGGGGIVWGGAAGQRYAFYGDGGAGLIALDPATGERAWQFMPAEVGRGSSLGAAPTAIPGVVFEGATNGTLYAVSAADGKELWSFDTAQSFETVNAVPAHGGSIASTGAVVVGGMVFIGSGYGISSAAAGGNVLLAFGVE